MALFYVIIYIFGCSLASGGHQQSGVSPPVPAPPAPCVDSPECAALPGACGHPDPALVHTLCPAKCGLCKDPFPDCQDSSSINCSAMTSDLCQFESAYHVCPRTCQLCDHDPSKHPCTDHVQGISCADLPDPCSDSVGIISCPLFCGICAAHPRPTTVTDAPSTTTVVAASGPCDDSPCVNGGLCTGRGFTFTCTCPQGYSGTLCDIVKGQPPLTTTPETDSTKPTLLTAATSLTTTTNMIITKNTTPVTHEGNTESPTSNVTGNSCKRNNKYELGCQPADVIFMIEYTKDDRNTTCSIDKQGDFVKNFLNVWGRHNSQMRVGIVTYHNTAEQRINLTDVQDIHDLKQAVTSITGHCVHGHLEGSILQPGGLPRMADAFEFVREHSFRGHRHGVAKVLIPIIHAHLKGPWRLHTVAAAQSLQAACVSVLPAVVHQDDDVPAVGVAAAHSVASQPHQDFYTEFSDFDELENSPLHGDYGSRCR